MIRSSSSTSVAERRLAWALMLPALGTIVSIALFPMLWTFWESLHIHDLRMPWRGRPFIGLANYAEALTDPRFWKALEHTAIFTVGSVALELVLGLLLALGLHRAYRGRGFVRTVVLVPWALPTVVSALLWGFIFDTQAGIVNAVLIDIGFFKEPFVWFIDTTAAWVPIVIADAWKMTPFVALLLLAGLQQIDDSLYEAARLDGASAWQQFVHVTLPLLRPTLLVAVIFRILDAIRVFDLIYVLTKGGPGTSTEPIALYTFTALMQNLRFDYGSALSVIIFLVTFLVALCGIRFMGSTLTESRR